MIGRLPTLAGVYLASGEDYLRHGYVAAMKHIHAVSVANMAHVPSLTPKPAPAGPGLRLVADRKP